MSLEIGWHLSVLPTGSADFENRIAEVMSRVDANHDGVLDEDESARAWGVLEDHLKTRQQTPLTPGHGNEEEHDAMVRAGLWNLMWRSVNATFGGPGGWKTMTAAMAGERTMDWGGALRNWRRVYDFMLRELTHAENKYLANMSSRRVLHEVLHDLSAGYTSTICKPGGLVDFQARELRVLGVEGAEIDAFLASREAGIRKRADMTPGAGWRRLFGRRITSKNKATRKSFQKEVEASSCHCMCYQKGERWTYGTHMSAADKPTCTRVENVPPGTGSISDIPEFAVDGILMKAPGNKTWQNLGKAFLKLIPATGGSSCRMMLEWELSGEKGGGIGYISKCEAPKPLRTSYWSTPSHTFEIVVYNLALDDPHEDASGHLVDTVQAHRASKKLLANRRLQNKWNTNLSLTTMEKMH
ncbi:unnamed protein product [Prorocentrum cordatum]|uniref:EF-hand domain-containing protein n=1 Tax=Prorocentrum cordatum TaxID=2364126 RepID=A0ABN9Q8T6_9DINO|nr:unnamed protein product [Polarella glacialis]